jgi:hypothetical protein
MKSKKGKTKHYFNELCKAVPHMKMRAAKKVINEMVNDGQLKYWSSGSTTLYLLPEHADVGDGQLKYWSSGSTTLYLLPEHADVGKEEEGIN